MMVNRGQCCRSEVAMKKEDREDVICEFQILFQPLLSLFFPCTIKLKESWRLKSSHSLRSAVETKRRFFFFYYFSHKKFRFYNMRSCDCNSNICWSFIVSTQVSLLRWFQVIWELILRIPLRWIPTSSSSYLKGRETEILEWEETLGFMKNQWPVWNGEWGLLRLQRYSVAAVNWGIRK